MSDADFYADPDNQQAGRAMRGPAGKLLSRHVAIRLSPDMASAAQQHADRDGLTLSSWVRRLVACEINRQVEPVTMAMKPVEVVIDIDGSRIDYDALTASFARGLLHYQRPLT